VQIRKWCAVASRFKARKHKTNRHKKRAGCTVKKWVNPTAPILFTAYMFCQILFNVAVIIIFMRQTYFLHTDFAYRGRQSLQKSRRSLKILGTRSVIWSNFHTKDPQILDSVIQNLVCTVTWHPWLVHPYLSTLNVIHNLKVSMLPCL